MVEPQKIPVWAAAKAAYHLGWEAFVALREATVIAIVLEFVIALLRPDPFEHPASSMLILVLLAILPAVLLAPFAVLIHRRILLREDDRNYLAAAMAPRTIHFAIAAALVTLGSMIGGIILTVATVVGWLGTLIGFVISIAAIFVVVRLLLGFPAVATDASSTPFPDSWHATRGSFWRIFWALFLTVLPMSVVSLLFRWVTGWGGVFWLVGMVATTVVSAFIFALAVALASHLYQTKAAWMQHPASRAIS